MSPERPGPVSQCVCVRHSLSILKKNPSWAIIDMLSDIGHCVDAAGAITCNMRQSGPIHVLENSNIIQSASCFGFKYTWTIIQRFAFHYLATTEMGMRIGFLFVCLRQIQVSRCLMRDYASRPGTICYARIEADDCLPVNVILRVML